MASMLRTLRFFSYAAVIVSSSVVLGLAANFASLFLPHIHRPFTIFALIVPAATIVIFILILLRSIPVVDAFILFVLDVLWLSLAAWSADVIGPIECFPLGGQKTPTNNGTMSLQTYCYEMKAIEAFSWANFGILLICFILLLIVVNRAQSMGRYGAWQESMSELPWFGQYGAPYGGGVYGPYGGAPMYPAANGQVPYVIQQAPGHSVVIQPNPGGVPTVTQLPGNVNSMM